MTKSRDESVNELFAALQQNDMELAANVLDDRFELVGWAPRPINKNQFLALHSELLDAMPDLSYNIEGVHRREDDDTVAATMQITGTHTNELSLPLFGIQSLPATGIALTLPQVPVIAQVDNEHITRLETPVITGGGLSGLLQQLGTELPLLLREDV